MQATEAAEVREIAPHIPAGLELGLRNYWYPILQSEELGREKPLAIRRLGEDLVVWRDGEGLPRTLRDRCPHRAAKLSIGRILDGQLQCIFHGLRFDGMGRCALIPWEPDDSPLREGVCVTAYPTRELAGYIWAYLGDTARFPPPPLEDEIPEELTRPDEFLWFRLPNMVWHANWLLAVDGSDPLHAVTLHAETQAVANEEWQGGAVKRPTVPLAERRIKLAQGSYGMRAISVDLEGTPIHQGHVLQARGQRFVMPTINTTPLVPAPGAAPCVSRLWQFPVDAHDTFVVRYEVARAQTAAERERWTTLFHDVVEPRLAAIAVEDAIVAEAQGDLVSARSDEHLFAPDADMMKVRLMLQKAFLVQLRGQRDAPTRDSLVYPL
ncbi:MAG TPA: aromatic ring-hydroxylating dioxygenase subunit alpha [Chloroflexota bacterium]|jgi:phenylpropionate dioxygenase-like ring-hydroxylating dioxygenase large terminal subunit